MLRINRTHIPALPRPIFEIQVEQTDFGDIQVTVMAGQGANIRVQTFSATPVDQLGEHLSSWLQGLPYFEPGHAHWASATDQLVTRIVQSIHGKPLESSVDELTAQRVLETAIDRLSAVTNTSTGLAHPLDESRAKELFFALRERKVPTPKGRVTQLAIIHGWPNRHAEKLGELAARIGSGANVQIAHPRGWGGPIVDELLSSSASH